MPCIKRPPWTSRSGPIAAPRRFAPRQMRAPRMRSRSINISSRVASSARRLPQALDLGCGAGHVRNYRIPEWQTMFAAAGFGAPSVHGWKLPLEFNRWVRRIATPPEPVFALKTVIKALPAEARKTGWPMRLNAASR